MYSILVIHGPNLNLLGKRETDIYGTVTLEQINQYIYDRAKELGVEVDILQSNFEGDIIEAIHHAPEKYRGIVINPAAFTHYSYAISDAIRAVDIPVVEVHLSNIHGREEYRKNSVTAPGAVGIISGFGYFSYLYGVESLINIMDQGGKKHASKS
jgi:3-dehydroquinate dehydratase II